jgi:hypothetical protein
MVRFSVQCVSYVVDCVEHSRPFLPFRETLLLPLPHHPPPTN